MGEARDSMPEDAFSTRTEGESVGGVDMAWKEKEAMAPRVPTGSSSTK